MLRLMRFGVYFETKMAIFIKLVFETELELGRVNYAGACPGGGARGLGSPQEIEKQTKGHQSKF